MNNDIPTQLRGYFEASNVALALASAGGDHPLVLVNAAFRSLTGYGDDEVIGRNCRFLQGEVKNEEPRERIRRFLAHGGKANANIRTPILNFRKDGSPFVNLLYMSKLRALGGEVRYVFASQFDVSRSQPELLAEYDERLVQTLNRLSPVLAESGIVLEGSLMTIANTAATVAQARLTLADLDGSPFA